MAALGGMAGAAHAQTPTPDPAPVPAPAPPPAPAPAAPPPPPVIPPAAAAPAAASEPTPKRERKRARPRARRPVEPAARPGPPADPPRTALIGARVEGSPAPAIAQFPRTLAEPQSSGPAQAALIFVFAAGLLGFVLALAPARLLASISAGLPEHRQDLGLVLVLVMALGAGFFVLLAAA